MARLMAVRQNAAEGDGAPGSSVDAAAELHVVVASEEDGEQGGLISGSAALSLPTSAVSLVRAEQPHPAVQATRGAHAESAEASPTAVAMVPPVPEFAGMRLHLSRSNATGYKVRAS